MSRVLSMRDGLSVKDGSRSLPAVGYSTPREIRCENVRRYMVPLATVGVL